MEKKYFKDFFVRFPPEYSEHYVIKQIHKTIEAAEKEHKECPDDMKYLKCMAKAYFMLEAYFVEKGVDPRTIVQSP